jgi:hypothetical protein
MGPAQKTGSTTTAPQHRSIAGNLSGNSMARSAVPVLEAKTPDPAVSMVPLVTQLKPKDSIDKPDVADRSADVPDLTKDQVTAINAAKSIDERQAVVKTIIEYLIVKNVMAIDDVDGDRKVLLPADKFEEDEFCIKIEYKDNDAYTGLTYLNGDLGPDKDQYWIRLDIYRPAFASPAILYSTIRHELIHAGQRTLQPANWKTPGDDELNYEYNESYGKASKKQKNDPFYKKAAKRTEKAYDKMIEDDRYTYAEHVGKDTTGPKSLQMALQEIEAHLWELEHADETGIQPDYFIATQKEVVDYLKQLQTSVAGATKLQKTYWKGYVEKTVTSVTYAQPNFILKMNTWGPVLKKEGEAKIKETQTACAAIKI